MAQGKSRRNRGKARRKRQCGDKVQYSKGEAVGAAIAMSKRRGVKYKAYPCRFCYLPSGGGAWHVGHSQTLSNRLGH